MQTLADQALSFTHGVAEIVRRHRFDDHAWRVGFVLPRFRGEFMETLPALEDLEVPESV